MDYDGEAQITGESFVATGSSGMAQNFASTSTQGSILANISNTQNGTVIIKDSTGNELASYNSP